MWKQEIIFKQGRSLKTITSVVSNVRNNNKNVSRIDGWKSNEDYRMFGDHIK